MTADAPDDAASPRDAALFDLAVNRAATYARRTGALRRSPADASDRRRLSEAVTAWATSTRFAYRIALHDIVECLSKVGALDGAWHGGRNGAWTDEAPPTP